MGIRDRRGLSLSLTEIEGVGEKRASALLKYFKTMTAIKNAEVDELTKAQMCIRDSPIRGHKAISDVQYYFNDNGALSSMVGIDGKMLSPVAPLTHGGGYSTGSCIYARTLTTKLAASTSMDVFCFDYRLAPEFPYPAAIDRKSTRLNSSHSRASRMPSSA